MGLRNSHPWVFSPKGLSDAIDGSSAFAGAMSELQNLVPNPANADQWVCRPAATETVDFADSFTAPVGGTGLLVVGTLAWGMMSSGRYPGFDEPFCYDLQAEAFVPIGNVTAANVPATQPSTGDWVPPTLCQSSSRRITITHPGYNGVSTFIGWVDFSGFTSLAEAGAANGTTTVQFGGNVLQGGWQVGFLFTGTDVPANTYILSIASDGLSAVVSNAVPAPAGATGTTNSSARITNLSVDVTTLGWEPGMPITGVGIPNDTEILSIDDGGLALWMTKSVVVATGTIVGGTEINALSLDVTTLGWQLGYTFTAPGLPGATTISSIDVDGRTITFAPFAFGVVPGPTHLAVVVPNVALSVGSIFHAAGGTPAAPLYAAGNVNGQPFTKIPRCCSGFSGRTWYGVGNYAVYSDELTPQQITAASQALQLGDNTDVTAFGGLPLVSQITGGAVQALIAFKGAETLFQITGDAATDNLTQNNVEGSVGTLAPNSICATTRGLAYVAPDGLRILGFNGIASDPIGRAGQGVHNPLVDCVNPSRIAAAFNNNVLQISVQPLAMDGQPFVSYFYDFDRDTWSGPHTFPLSIVRPYYGGSGSDCLGFAVNAPTKLWQVPVEPRPDSTYLENGVELTWTFTTTLLPDNQSIAANAMIETNLATQITRGQSLSITATSENEVILDELTLVGPPIPPATLWGQFLWGQAPWGYAGTSNWDEFNWGTSPWGSLSSYFRQRLLSWSEPLVFKQMHLTVEGASTAELVIGNIYLRYQELGYNLPYGDD